MAVAENFGRNFGMKSDKVKVEKSTITPEMAQEWLDLESPNRPISMGTVDAYARRMAENKWQFNGEAIQFARDGSLLNGQHRLMACVKSGMPFEALVVTGLPRETQATMDDPRKRTVNDMQRITGLNYPASASAAARWLLRIRLGSIQGARRVTNSEVYDVLVKHPGLGESALQLKDREIVALLPSIVTALHYIGSKLLMLPEKANSFVEVMATGVPAYDGDPVHLWREKLIRAKTHGNGLSARDQWDGSVHAWNLFVENAKLKRFLIPEEVMIENLDIRKI